MIKLFFFLFTFFISPYVHAVDASSDVTEVKKFGRWTVVEFAGTKQLVYRISSESINIKNNYISFDFFPSKNCVADHAVLISELNSYVPEFDGGLLIYEYIIPGQKQGADLIKIEMSRGDKFAFFVFNKLSVDMMLKSKDKGKLTIWIPASGDGVVKKSGNIYFSLEGFTSSYREANRLCTDSK